MSRTLPEWLDYIERQHPAEIEMGLDRVRAVWTRLGAPRPAAHVITVGGTNGKGSTVAFIEAIARAAGLCVGAYTSPHLLRYNERVRIDGRDADDAALVRAFEAVDAARGGVALTYFEYGTLAALWLFQQAGLDLVVLEVGLGGRLDATNLIDADVAVITTVDLDHQAWLGPDREAIGTEKAGIARAWKPLVLGDDDPPSTVLRRAYAIGASAVRIGCDFFFEPVDDASWRWREVGCEWRLPRPALDAPVQLRNAAIAIAALRTLDLPIGEEAAAAGVASARVRGRLESFEREGVRVVVDVAHNPQAATELARWIAARPPTTVHAVFAALADKDVAGIVEALTPHVAHWHLAGLVGCGPRGVQVAALAARLPAALSGRARLHDDVGTALAAARAAARPGDLVLVFGSFHTAAAALAALEPG